VSNIGLVDTYTFNCIARRELEESLKCYDECNDQLVADGKDTEWALEHESLRRVVLKYCEGRFTSGHASKIDTPTYPIDLFWLFGLT